MDRVGRLLTDVAPHIYKIAYGENSNVTGSNNENADNSSSLAGNVGSMTGRDDSNSVASADIGRINDISIDEDLA